MTVDMPTSTGSRYCGAKKRQGEGCCRRPAGWGTPHPGRGTCKLHLGSTRRHRTSATYAEAEAQLAAVKAALVEQWRAHRQHPAPPKPAPEWLSEDYWRQQFPTEAMSEDRDPPT
jgi:hypothetical protein